MKENKLGNKEIPICIHHENSNSSQTQPLEEERKRRNKYAILSSIRWRTLHETILTKVKDNKTGQIRRRELSEMLKDGFTKRTGALSFRDTCPLF